MQSNEFHRSAGKTGDPDLHSIGDVSKSNRVTLRALRFYEERGLIQPVRIGASRFYDAAARARLQLILKGKHLGFTLSEICEMIAAGTSDSAPLYELSLGADKVMAQMDMLQRQRSRIELAIAELRRTHEKMSSAPRAAPAEARDSFAA